MKPPDELRLGNEILTHSVICVMCKLSGAEIFVGKYRMQFHFTAIELALLAGNRISRTTRKCIIIIKPCIIIPHKIYPYIKENHAMKLEIERSDFLKAWQVAERYAGTKTTMDTLSGIRITADNDGNVTLEATDLKASVLCRTKAEKLHEPGSAVLNAGILGNMLRKSSAKSITLEASETKGTLTAGKSRSRFAVIRAESFPKIPASSGGSEIFSGLACDLGKLISEGCSAASAPSDFPKYMGTCLLRTSEGKLLAVSTDGKRLARSQAQPVSISRDEDLILPAAALKELAKIFTGDENVKVLADDSTVWFVIEAAKNEEPENKEVQENEDSTESEEASETKEAKPAESYLDGAEFSIRRIEANFPKYERILNNEVYSSMRISRAQLMSSLDRIAVIAKNTPGQIMAMHLQPQDDSHMTNELLITAKARGLGTSIETLEPEDITGNELWIGFNLGYFTEGLKAVGSDDLLIEFSEPEGQTRLLRDNSEDFLYMLMPIRLTEQDKDLEDDDAPAEYEEEVQSEEAGEAPQEQESTDEAPF